MATIDVATGETVLWINTTAVRVIRETPEGFVIEFLDGHRVQTGCRDIEVISECLDQARWMPVRLGNVPDLPRPSWWRRTFGK